MDRRDFLRLGSNGLGALAVLACDDDSRPQTRPAGENVSRPVAQPVAVTAPAAPEEPPLLTLEDLQRHLDGRLLTAADPDYQRRRLLNNSAFDGVLPRAIAEVHSATDVARCIRFARHAQLPFSVLSGGHSYLGASTSSGLVIHLGALNHVQLEPASQRALVQAGCQLIDVYAQLAARGRTIPAGSCPTVGIAGLALGGGHGLTARAFGLTCDRIVGMEVVTARGELLEVSESNHADLFWALRGGGGSFGVVTRFTLTTEPLPAVATTLMLKYDWLHAGDALLRWMKWIGDLPAATSVVARLATTGELVVAGVHLGPVEEARGLIEPLLQNVSKRSMQGQPFLDAMFLEAACSQRSLAECHVAATSPGGQLKRSLAFAAASHYFDGPLQARAVDTALARIDAHKSSLGTGAGSIQFDAYGGAINTVPKDATAFVHRAAHCSAQYASYFGKGDQAAHRAWVANTREVMASFSNGEAYQNYNDASLPNWESAYYGANLARLKELKRLYDPENVFRFTQSIAP